MTNTVQNTTKQSNNTILFPNYTPPSRTRVYSNGTVDPIVNSSDIELVKHELLHNTGKYGLRNYCIFTMAINCGLRCGDLVRLKLSDICTNIECNTSVKINYKDIVTIKESKTKKLKVFKLRTGVKTVLTEYITTTFTNFTTLNQYLFPSQKAPLNNEKYLVNSITNEVTYNDKYIEPDSMGLTHMKRNSFGNILNNEVQQRLSGQFSVPINLNTHSGRKTFARHFYDSSVQQDRDSSGSGNPFEQNALTQLMVLLNHSSLTQTLKYLGIQRESVLSAYDMEAL